MRLPFYHEGLGLTLAGKGPNADAPVYANFPVQHGLSLVLVTEAQFKEFTHIDTAGKRASQMILSFPKASRAAVDLAYNNAMSMGGKSIQAPQERDVGYVASLLDPDGNVVEIIEDNELPDIELG